MTTALFKFLLFLTIIIAPLAYQSTVQNTSADTTDLQTYEQVRPPFTPSPDPIKRGIFYTQGGFKKNYYTFKSLTINDDFTLNLQAVRPPLPAFLTYSWWISDNKTD